MLLCKYGWFKNAGVFEPPGWRNQRMFLVAKGRSLQKKEFCSLRLPQFLWFLPPDCCKGISDCLMGFSVTEWLIFSNKTRILKNHCHCMTEAVAACGCKSCLASSYRGMGESACIYLLSALARLCYPVTFLSVV